MVAIRTAFASLALAQALLSYAGPLPGSTSDAVKKTTTAASHTTTAAPAKKATTTAPAKTTAIKEPVCMNYANPDDGGADVCECSSGTLSTTIKPPKGGCPTTYPLSGVSGNTAGTASTSTGLVAVTSGTVVYECEKVAVTMSDNVLLTTCADGASKTAIRTLTTASPTATAYAAKGNVNVGTLSAGPLMSAISSALAGNDNKAGAFKTTPVTISDVLMYDDSDEFGPAVADRGDLVVTIQDGSYKTEAQSAAMIELITHYLNATASGAGCTSRTWCSSNCDDTVEKREYIPPSAPPVMETAKFCNIPASIFAESLEGGNVLSHLSVEFDYELLEVGGLSLCGGITAALAEAFAIIPVPGFAAIGAILGAVSLGCVPP